MSFPGKVLTLVVIAALAAAVWLLREVILLVFGGILLAVVVCSLADLVTRISGMGWRLAVTVSVLLVLVLLAGLGMWLGTGLATQAAELTDSLPKALDAVRKWVASEPLGSQLLARWQELQSHDVPLGRLASGAALGASMLGDLVLLSLLAIFLAVDPGLYRAGALRLVPVRHREAVHEALDQCGAALRGWLKGQGVSMLVVGIATGTGLWLLGVPLAFLLGALAGVLEFVPLVGPIVSGSVAVLIAFLQGPQTALYVALLAFGIQQLESNVLIPVLQKWAVELPPALALVAVVIAVTLFGYPGVLLSTPMIVVTMVLVRRLYVERVLEGGSNAPDQHPGQAGA